MKHTKADAVLPKKLLMEIQKYVQGESIYIPKLKGNYKKWGDNTQSKTIILTRNHEIRSAFYRGHSIDELSKQYSLSQESIKKIVYQKI